MKKLLFLLILFPTLVWGQGYPVMGRNDSASTPEANHYFTATMGSLKLAKTDTTAFLTLTDTTYNRVMTKLDADELQAQLDDTVVLSTVAVMKVDSSITPKAGGYPTSTMFYNGQAAKANLLTSVKYVAPVGFNGLGIANADIDATTANVVMAVKFYLPFKITVNKIGVIITTGDAGDTIAVGIYDDAGTTKLIDGGRLSSTSTGYVSGAVSSVVLNPGFYWAAYSNTVNAIRIKGFYNGATGGIWQDAYIYGSCANKTVTGVLPAALGTVSASANNGPLIILTNY